MDNNEIQIEHFGFSAERVSLERRLFIRKILDNAFDAVLKKIDCSQDTMVHLAQQKEVVTQNILHSINEQVTTADFLDKRNFIVPQHVLLPQYFDHIKAISVLEEEQIDFRLRSQRQLFLENSVMLASLRLENDRYRRLKKFIDDEVHLQQLLNDSFSNLNMNQINKVVQKSRSYSL